MQRETNKIQVNAQAACLLYWPAATVVGSLCDAKCPTPFGNVTKNPGLAPICSASRSVIMPSAPGILTTTLHGYTLTSPTVYYSFYGLTANAYAWDSYAPGPFITNTIIPINSADVSTIPGATLGVARSIDWSDLNAPVPLQAYHYVDWYPDEPILIYDHGYTPWLSIPANIVDLEPSWSTCTIARNGAFDPPHALHAEEAPAQPVDPMTSVATSIPIITATPLPGPTASSPIDPPSSVAVPSPRPDPVGAGGDPGAGLSSGPPSDPSLGSGTGSDPGAPDPGSGFGGSSGFGKGGSSNSGGEAVPKHGSGSGSSLGDDSAHGSGSGSGFVADPTAGSGAEAGSDVGSDTGSESSSHRSGSGADSASESNRGPALENSGNGPGGEVLSILGVGFGSGPNSGSETGLRSGLQISPSSGSKGSGQRVGGAIISIVEGGSTAESGSESSGSSSDAFEAGSSGTDSGANPGDKSGTGHQGSSHFQGLGTGAPTRSSESDGELDLSAQQDGQSGTPTTDPSLFGSGDSFAIVESQLVYAGPSRSGAIVVGSHTISPGDPAVMVDGTSISVGSGGYMVIGTSSVKIPTATNGADVAFTGGSSGVVFTSGSQTMTAVKSNGNAVIQGNTQGPAKTIDGEVISNGPHCSVAVEGTESATVPFSPNATGTVGSGSSVSGAASTAPGTNVPLTDSVASTHRVACSNWRSILYCLVLCILHLWMCWRWRFLFPDCITYNLCGQLILMDRIKLL